jgi:hypothetical protein
MDNFFLSISMSTTILVALPLRGLAYTKTEYCYVFYIAFGLVALFGWSLIEPHC